MPMIVMQKRNPAPKCISAISHQPKRIQIRFIITDVDSLNQD